MGETMVLLTADEGNIEAARHVGVHIGGAESNVASGLAHLGHHVEWWSRLGCDPFGNIIEKFLRSRSVDTGFVFRDPARQTGIYFKDRDSGAERVHYYRAGSAASAMGPDDQAVLSLEKRTLLHLSGITAALSASSSELMQRLIVDREPSGPTISFDVNYRPGIWSAEAAAPRLLELASAADIVLVGRDEAEVLWGTKTPDHIRGLLPHPVELVVKDADVGATHYRNSASVFVPALRTTVVDVVGAGDAFAAGFLSGTLRGLDVAQTLRLGHVMAALTIQHVSDLPKLPATESILAVSAIGEQNWSGITLAPRHLEKLETLAWKEP
jgi:2-dehydro-3-deoxygluconokinase